MPAIEFTIRRKVFTLFGAKFHIFGDDGALIGYSEQKAFKLKEDIRVFSDESKSAEKLAVRARSIIDFSAAYDVYNSLTQTKIGALKRKGFASLIRDSWIVFDPHDGEIGAIREDNLLLALIRRHIAGWLVPQHFIFHDAHNQQLAEFRTHFNPFVHRLTVRIEPQCPVDPVLILAAGILLVAIEGRQT